MSSEIQLSAIPIDQVLGPVMLGCCINAFLYGFSVLQFVQYRTRLFRDRLPTQLLVTWTFLIDTAHTVALCWMIWLYIVDNFTNPPFLFTAPWPLTATPFFLVFTSGPIQVYFAHRLFQLSRSRLLYWGVMLLSLADTVMGVASTIYAITHADVHDFKLLLPVVDTWLGLSVLCDSVISGTLIYYLTRNRSGFRRHEAFKNRVAHAFIESSILTAICALADLIIYSIVPNTNYHIIVGIPMGRVYTCTLLAMLNARLKLREDEADGIISPEHHSYERHVEFANALQNIKRGQTQIRVGVSVQEDVDVVRFGDTPSISRDKVRGVNATDSEYSGDALDHKSPGFDA